MKVSKASACGLHALMYMVRHATLRPATVEAIAKTEGIPAGRLSRVLQCLTQAGFVRLADGPENGYVFARPPEKIAPIELLAALEGQPVFDDRALPHGESGGTPEDCRISAEWVAGTSKIGRLFEEKTIVTAAWKDLEHRSGALPQDPDPAKPQIKSLDPRGQSHSQGSRTPG